MLSELDDLGSSNEEIWGAARVSFTIETRDESGDELIEREYTFSHAPEWDKWVFYEFEERRSDDTRSVADRNWRRSRNIFWDDPRSMPDVPPEVNERLTELLNVDELTIQNY